MTINTLDVSHFALDVRGLDRMRHSAAGNPEAGIAEVARQFEALLLQTMLKSMRDAGPQSDFLSSQQTRFYDDLMDQQWAQHLAGRGIGLAEQLIKQLSSQEHSGR